MKTVGDDSQRMDYLESRDGCFGHISYDDYEVFWGKKMGFTKTLREQIDEKIKDKPEQPNEAGSEGLLVKAYEDYLHLLNDELNDLASIATVHGWKSRRFEAGQACREKIAALRRAVAAKGASKVAVDDPLWCPICNTRHLFGTACRLPVKGAIAEEQPTQKFSLRCTKCGDLRDVHIPMNEPGFAYSGKCSRCGGEVVLDNYHKPAEEQDKGSKLEAGDEVPDYVTREQLILMWRAARLSARIGIKEVTTLHKIVGEMVEVMVLHEENLDNWVNMKKPGNWNDRCSLLKLTRAVLARAKLEIGEGR